MLSKVLPSEPQFSMDLPAQMETNFNVSMKRAPCTFTKVVRRKLLVFQKVVGMPENPDSYFMIWYRRALLTLLFLTALRRSTQISLLPPGSTTVTVAERMLDPIVVLSMTRFIFLFAGFYTATTLTRSYRARMAFLQMSICQCFITLFCIDFFLSCTYIRYVIANLCLRMQRDFKSSPPLVKLQHLDEIQTQHHSLVTAKRKLEDCYSLHVFVFYGMSIPAVCFLSYVAYRNAGPGIVIWVGIWILVIIWHLLILSLPAFQMTEEGEDIATCAFELYNNCLKREEDTRISSQMQILISQIQSNKMTISAYNYFPMNRSILLTMFSAIFTYFLILVQFSEEEVNVSSDLAKAVEICRNHTL